MVIGFAGMFQSHRFDVLQTALLLYIQFPFNVPHLIQQFFFLYHPIPSVWTIYMRTSYHSSGELSDMGWKHKIEPFAILRIIISIIFDYRSISFIPRLKRISFGDEYYQEPKTFNLKGCFLLASKTMLFREVRYE